MGIGLLGAISDETLPVGIPFQRTSEFVADRGQLAQGGGAVARLRRCDRGALGSNRFHPIGDVILGARKTSGLGDRGFEQVRVAGSQVAASRLDPTIGSLESTVDVALVDEFDADADLDEAAERIVGTMGDRVVVKALRKQFSLDKATAAAEVAAELARRG